MEFLKEVIFHLFHDPTTHLKPIQSISGGCINYAGVFEYSNEKYFLKWNIGAADLFEKEKRGLELLRETNVLGVPRVIGTGKTEKFDFLCLEFIRKCGVCDEYWQNFGRQLADLHKITSDQFGLHFNNHIGSLNQSNNPHQDWGNFFVEERLIPQVNLAIRKNVLTKNEDVHFEIFYKKVPELFPNEAPALIHGDLWSGNILCGLNNRPYVFDPAVYYGHREMELAFTKMFGGFDAKFYSSYYESFPVAPGFEDRIDLYNLYPLLVHLNLFGSSYLAPILNTLKRFI